MNRKCLTTYKCIILSRRKERIHTFHYIHLPEQNNVRCNIETFILYLRTKTHSSEFLSISNLGIPLAYSTAGNIQKKYYTHLLLIYQEVKFSLFKINVHALL